MKVTLNVKLTPKQLEADALAKTHRFLHLEWARRVGKTVFEGKFLITNALLRKDKHWYVTKTLGLARDEFFPGLMDLLPRDLVRKIDERLLTVWLTNGSVIMCKSAEKEDNLRGRGLGSYVLDEAAFIKGHVHERILRPQLAVSQGPALLGSSPKKGWFTSQSKRIQRGEMKDWAYSHATIYDNPHITREEIEQIKATTPVNTWLQEYMAQEVSDEGQVYEEFSATANVYNPADRFSDVKDWVTLRGLDWGRADDTGVVWLGISPEGYLVISDEHAQSGWDPQKHADTIHSKSTPYKQIHSSILDRTAFRSESDGTSVADQFRDAGVPCQPSERDVDASVNIIKRFLRGDGQTPWLYVSAKCGKLIDALQNWEHGDHEPDIAAAMRYAATWAVSKKLTRLSDAIPTARPLDVKVKESDANRILAQHARLVPVSKKRAWSWDRQHGVPL